MEAQSGSYWRSVPLEDFMRGFIWLALALLLLFAWIGSFVMYHVAGFLIDGTTRHPPQRRAESAEPCGFFDPLAASVFCGAYNRFRL